MLSISCYVCIHEAAILSTSVTSIDFQYWELAFSSKNFELLHRMTFHIYAIPLLTITVKTTLNYWHVQMYCC